MKYCIASEEEYFKKIKCSKKCEYYETCTAKDNEERRQEYEENEKYMRTTSRHDKGELAIMQGYSLERKIQLTCERIQAWYEHYDGKVYISFSGGKDSTVLLDIVRNRCGYTDVPAVFCDTGLEYPELREFVNTIDNVVILKPKKNFKQIIKEYGYPIFGKEIAETIFYSRRYIEKLKERESNIDGQAEHVLGFPFMADLLGVDRREDKDNPTFQAIKNGNIPSEMLLPEDAPIRVKMMFGQLPHKEKGKLTGEYSVRYDRSKYQFMLNAPFECTKMCCNIMKKTPMKSYERETGRKGITGQMADESKLREQNWIKNGCNGFYMAHPISNPMAFWTEQNVLEYIKKYNLPIASVYGDIVEDIDPAEEVQGQMSFADCEMCKDWVAGEMPTAKLKTTGCERTGCTYCMFGIQQEKSPNRLEKLKVSHPKLYEYVMKPTSEGGLGYKEIIDWINANGNMDIKY